jgi:hypothetical protein
MSEFTDQLARIHTLVEGVTNIGKVYDRPRHGTADRLWTAEIAGIPLIRAWEIGLAGDTVTDRVAQGNRTRFRPWRIQGYVGPIDIQDDDPDNMWFDPAEAQNITPGYKAALDLAEGIAEAIEGDRTLGGTCLDIASPEDDQIGTRISDPDVFSIPQGPLCWTISIEFWTWTHIT